VDDAAVGGVHSLAVDLPIGRHRLVASLHGALVAPDFIDGLGISASKHAPPPWLEFIVKA